MDASLSIRNLLCDPQVKTCYLRLLESSLSAEEKYQQFVDFCAQIFSHPVLPDKIRVEMLPLFIIQEESTFDMQQILARTLDAIAHTVGRMQRSQHQDGGWGLQIEQSNFWGTAYAVQFLKAAYDLPNCDSSRVIRANTAPCRGLFGTASGILGG